MSLGGEKEGSSGLITRVMGPNATAFKTYISNIEDSKREIFLREFLGGIKSKKILQTGVRDVNYNEVPWDLSALNDIDPKSSDINQLIEAFNKTIDAGGNRFFSFLTPKTRMSIFKGKFAGLNNEKLSKKIMYQYWSPLYGEPEKYIFAVHGTGAPGWEINFKPQPSYGDFELMLDWFRGALENAGSRFESLGHQWIVLPKRPNQSPEEIAVMEAKMAEVFRMGQALIVLGGMRGGSNIELGNYKNVQSDAQIAARSQVRGVIRFLDNSPKLRSLNGNRGYANEQRAGTKHDPVRRSFQYSVISRYVANDYAGIQPIQKWSLYTGSSASSADLIKRFGVTRLEADLALKVLGLAAVKMGKSSRTISPDYWVPFWTWENAPFLSDLKKSQIKELTRAWIRSLAAWGNPTGLEVQQSLRTWITVANLEPNIERYVRPAHPELSEDFSSEEISTLGKYEPPGGFKAGQVDINTIDTGIEYTTRFPLASRSIYTDFRLADNKKAWLAKNYDYTPEQRTAVIKEVAEELAKRINGNPTPLEVADGEHGHALVIAFKFKDKTGKSWRVEWDGVGRDYDEQGELVDSSERGGHIEVVTPKGVESPEQTRAVFETFDALGMIPSSRAGGGHVNVDLEPFKGKPHAFARFLAAFLANRGTMSLLFQSPNRLNSALPHDVSHELFARLMDFHGTEEELMQLLYNNHFFNERLGRKSKYTQMDVTPYFQDVIPPEFVTQDFDIKNDIWRKTFNLDPRIRKVELRLMDAPLNASEAALQKQFVRALLHFALNSDAPLPEAEAQPIDYVGWAGWPNTAYKMVSKSLATLQLDPPTFLPVVENRIRAIRESIESGIFVSIEDKLRDFPKQSDWGQAVARRTEDEAISSENRPWDPSLAEAEAHERKQLQTRVRTNAVQIRNAQPEITTNTIQAQKDSALLYKKLDDFSNFQTQAALSIAFNQLGHRTLADDFNEKALEEETVEYKVVEQLLSRDDLGEEIKEELSRMGHRANSYNEWLAKLGWLALTQNRMDSAQADQWTLGVIQSKDPVIRFLGYAHLAHSSIEDQVRLINLQTTVKNFTADAAVQFLRFGIEHKWQEGEAGPRFEAIARRALYLNDSTVTRLAAGILLKSSSEDLKIEVAEQLLKSKSTFDQRLGARIGATVVNAQTLDLANLLGQKDPEIKKFAEQANQLLLEVAKTYNVSELTNSSRTVTTRLRIAYEIYRDENRTQFDREAALEFAKNLNIGTGPGIQTEGAPIDFRIFAINITKPLRAQDLDASDPLTENPNPGIRAAAFNRITELLTNTSKPQPLLMKLMTGKWSYLTEEVAQSWFEEAQRLSRIDYDNLLLSGLKSENPILLRLSAAEASGRPELSRTLGTLARSTKNPVLQAYAQLRPENVIKAFETMSATDLLKLSSMDSLLTIFSYENAHPSAPRTEKANEFFTEFSKIGFNTPANTLSQINPEKLPKNLDVSAFLTWFQGSVHSGSLMAILLSRWINPHAPEVTRSAARSAIRTMPLSLQVEVIADNLKSSDPYSEAGAIANLAELTRVSRTLTSSDTVNQLAATELNRLKTLIADKLAISIRGSERSSPRLIRALMNAIGPYVSDPRIKEVLTEISLNATPAQKAMIDFVARKRESAENAENPSSNGIAECLREGTTSL